MKILLPFLLAISIFWSCDDNTPVEPEQPTTPTTPVDTAEYDTLYYLALGDSYTIGESVSIQARFPNQLRDSLLQSDIPQGGQTDKKIDVRIIAQTGWRTDQLQQAINNNNGLRSNYDLVSLLIGVNNQYQGRSVEDYKVEFKQLLEKAIVLAGNNKDNVFVVSIPDYAYTPFGAGDQLTSQEIDTFNAANKTITEDLGIRYFDITPISREGLNDTELVAPDDLHPSGKQYTQWVESFLNEVENMVF